MVRRKKRKDIFDFSQYHRWYDWYSFYGYHKDLYMGKLLDRTIDRQRYSQKVIRGFVLKKGIDFLDRDDKSYYDHWLDGVRYAGNYKTCVKSDKIWKAVTLKRIIGSIIGFPRIYWGRKNDYKNI